MIPKRFLKSIRIITPLHADVDWFSFPHEALDYVQIGLTSARNTISVVDTCGPEHGFLVRYAVHRPCWKCIPLIVT